TGGPPTSSPGRPALRVLRSRNGSGRSWVSRRCAISRSGGWSLPRRSSKNRMTRFARLRSTPATNQRRLSAALSSARSVSRQPRGAANSTTAAARCLDAANSFRHDAPTGGLMATAPFAVFVAATLIILAVFVAVARSSRDSRAVDYTRVNRLRLQFFVALSVVLLLFLLLTIRRLPYPVEARTPDRVVNAVGKQYAWSLTDSPGTGPGGVEAPTLATWDRDFSPTVNVAAGTTVEFRVTTLDVN